MNMNIPRSKISIIVEKRQKNIKIISQDFPQKNINVSKNHIFILFLYLVYIYMYFLDFSVLIFRFLISNIVETKNIKMIFLDFPKNYKCFKKTIFFMVFIFSIYIYMCIFWNFQVAFFDFLILVISWIFRVSLHVSVRIRDF